MSLTRSVVKLNTLKPSILASRNYAGGWNHIIVGPPTNRMPLWKKSIFMGTFTMAMFTYPLYVTYMMYEWDRMDNNF